MTKQFPAGQTVYATGTVRAGLAAETLCEPAGSSRRDKPDGSLYSFQFNSTA